MCIDYQVPVPMSDGAVLRADVFRPCEDARYPVILSHGVYAKGLRLQRPDLPDAVGQARGQGSQCPRGLHRQVSGLGGHRPGALGPRRICGRPRRLTRGGLVARHPLAPQSPGVRRHRRVRGVGGRATLEQRQGRGHGHLLLRSHGLGRRRAAARAPGRLHRLGGIQRPLSRRLLPRWDPQRVQQALAGATDQPDPIWSGISRTAQPEHGAIGGGAGGPLGRGARAEPGRVVPRAEGASPSTTIGIWLGASTSGG